MNYLLSVVFYIIGPQTPYPGLCGALQEAPMKALICRQMEGGEKAFRSRYERILS